MNAAIGSIKYFVKFLQVLVDAREILNIPWSNPKRQYSAHKILEIHNVNELDIRLFRQCAPIISDLWQDKAIKDAYDRRREFQIVSDIKSKYFFLNFFLNFLNLNCRVIPLVIL